MNGGQARAGLRQLGAVVLALPLLAGLALAALAWRLADGPIPLTPLARLIERAANDREDGPRLEVGRASLAWEGWRGGAAPLDIRLEGVSLHDATTGLRASLPDAAVSLALRPLLRGEIVPGAIALRGPRLALARGADGGVSAEAPGVAALLAELLGDGGRLTALRRITVEDGEVAVADAALGLEWSLTGITLELRREGPGLAAEGRALLAAGAARVPVGLGARIAGATATLRLDLPALRTGQLAALPGLAPLSQIEAVAALQAVGEFALDGGGAPRDLRLVLATEGGGELRPRPGLAIPFASLEAELSATPGALLLRRARLGLPGGEAVRADGALAAVEGAGWAGTLAFALEGAPTVAGLSRHWPEALAPRSRAAALSWLPEGRLSGARLSLDLAADATLSGWRANAARVEARLDDARLRLPGAPAAVPVRRVEAALELAPDRLRLHPTLLHLTGGAGAAETVVRVEAEGALAASGWSGIAEARVDRVRFQDLAALWPDIISPNARRWVTGNLTAGEARDGRWRFDWVAGVDFAEPRLTGLTGTARAEGATVHWLAPIAPARGVSADIAFSKAELVVRATGGRQEDGAGRPTGVEMRAGTVRLVFTPPGAPDQAEMEFRLAGPAADIVEVLKHPRLRLFDRRPFPFRIAAGAAEGRLTLAFPLLDQIPPDALRLRAEARVTGGRLERAVLDRDLDALALDINVDLQTLRIAGTGALAAIPLRLNVETDLRPGAAGAVYSRETATARADAAQIAALGFDTGGFAQGPVALDLRAERRRGGASAVTIRADLRDTRLAIAPLRWAKAPGQPGSAEAVLRFQEERLTGLDSIRLDAPELSARGRAQLRQGRVERIEIAESRLAAGRFSGEARTPAGPSEPWQLALRGPLLDLRALFAPGAPPPDPPNADGAPVRLDARFDRVLLGEGRELFGAQARGRADGRGVLREAELRARAGSRQGGAVEATLVPRRDGSRQLRASAEDAGALLAALGITTSIAGGTLSLDAAYAEDMPGAVLRGAAELDGFAVRDAPALGKLLQAVTLFGLVDAMQGGSGLAFSRAVVPFALSREELRIEEARAFSASLGLTARGRVRREPVVLDLEGTIVPAYLLNTALGNLPVLGRLFSPERGGGLFAATFRVQGPAEEALVSVNPLAALTPGFLRGLFQLAPAGDTR